MNRITELEKRYVIEALDNQFQSSKNSIFNNKLEKLFAEKFKSQFAIGVVNGTATMHTALLALEIGQGDEVIVPPLTMSSPAIATLQANAIPIFADVDPKTFCICPKSIKENITSKTKAIITVSLYGLSPDYDEILKLCKEYNIALIEDNAECFLGKYKGKLVGEFGDFSSYSFQATKHMTSGEGGMLTTNNPDLADKARKLTSLGYAGVTSSKRKIDKNDIQDPAYDRHVSLGYNFRMSEVQAAVALGQLERLEELVQNRIECGKIFKDVIDKTDLLTLQGEPEGYVNSYWSFSCLLNTDQPQKDWYAFRERFQSLGGDNYYAAWKLSYHEPLFAKTYASQGETWQKYEPGLCPNAEFVQPRMLQFKTDYWNLDEAREQAKILAQTIEGFKRS